MRTLAVIGAQWGDEGKGRVVDLFAKSSDYVVRFQGGANAGHTIVTDAGQEVTVHQLPAGIVWPDVHCVLANGVVVDPDLLISEMGRLRASGVAVTRARLSISDRAHVTLPYHVGLDQPTNRTMQSAGIRTTGHGVRPTLVDKVARIGIRVVDLFDESSLRSKLAVSLSTRIHEIDERAAEAMVARVMEKARGWREELEPFVTDTVRLINQAIDAGSKVLFEGAQGSGLDVDLGTYPYVTSSSPTAGGICTGAGVPPRSIRRVLGVAKSYITKDGDIDPFPSLMDADTEARFCDWCDERPSADGRPRRIGWFDAVIVRYAAMINGMDALALTRLDSLDRAPVLKICREYRHAGRPLRGVVSDSRVMNACEPDYVELPGWLCSTQEARSVEDLPKQARAFVDRLVDLCGVPAAFITVGRRRSATIVVDESYGEYPS